MTSSELEIETVAPGPELNRRKDDIWRVLEATDKDFVPALSSRTPTTLGALQPSGISFSLPIEHLDFQLSLHVIFASVDGRVVGFLSYLPNFEHDAIPGINNAVLVDTVAVMPAWRRTGVARRLYKEVFASQAMNDAEHVVLHTWSTNFQHGNLIDQLGFKEIDRIVDERAPGIDTLILSRPSTPNPFTS